ncbi:MAG: NAD(P)H-hydrate epimerase [Phycisphaerae bacterium]|jgi:NAD(P)H-hydrate epimerase
MRPLSRQEVRQIDQYAIGTLGVSGLVLMENAGRGAADAIQDFLGGSVAAKAVAVVAGSGNNGGDGFVVARHLVIRGAKVATFQVCSPDKLTADAAANLAILQKLGHDVRQVGAEELGGLAQQLRQFDVVVDAIGGTGVRGALRGEMAAAVQALNAAGRPVAAIDIPTGLDCDTGAAEGPAVRAALTVTFVARKKGFNVPGAEAYTGKVVVADIGIPAEVVERMAEPQ